MNLNEIKITCIIPAKGTSTRLPNKNLCVCNGVPLIGRAVRLARACECFDKILVSTESMNVLSVAASYGHKDYYIRPDEYATPECPVEEAIAHALYYLKCKSLVTDYVCLIHPTSPCLRAETLYQAMTLLADTPSADMLISVTDANVPHGTIPVTNNMGPYLSAASQRKRTQDCPKRFKLNNAIVAGRWDVFAGKEDYCLQRVIQFPMAASDSVDIDTQDDLNIAEAILMWREKNERKS